MLDGVEVKTFKLEDLIGRVVKVQSFKDKHVELIIAQDLNSNELFLLKSIQHPTE